MIELGMITGDLGDEDEDLDQKGLEFGLKVNFAHRDHFDPQEVYHLRRHLTGFGNDSLDILDMLIELILRQAINEHKPVETAGLDLLHQSQCALADVTCLLLGFDKTVHAFDHFSQKLSLEPFLELDFQILELLFLDKVTDAVIEERLEGFFASERFQKLIVTE